MRIHRGETQREWPSSEDTLLEKLSLVCKLTFGEGLHTGRDVNRKEVSGRKKREKKKRE